MAEEEREQEGIDSAMKNGIQLDRPTVLITEVFKEVFRKWKVKEPKVEAMKETRVKTSFYKLVTGLEAEPPNIYIE